jgi:hypothetical protein
VGNHRTRRKVLTDFDRERFLYWLFATVLFINALFFGIGVVVCSKKAEPLASCPTIGDRFDSFSERTMASVLGLIAGSAAAKSVASRQRTKGKDDA